MALIRANNDGVISMALSLPLVGAWVGDLVVDADDMSGAVKISVDDGRLVFKGTAVKGGGFLETTTIRVLAGAGRIGEKAKPRHYGAVRLGTVLRDLLRDVGERLSSTASDAVLNTQLDAWTTHDLPTGDVIALLMKTSVLAAVWRFLPDGTVWVGVDAWPDSGLQDGDYQITDEYPEQRSAMVAPDPLPPMPGTKLAGRKVSRVEYRLGEQLRALVFFQDGAGDRLRAAWDGAVRGALPESNYYGLCWARIVKQAGAFVDVEPEKAGIPDMAGVPLIIGWNGAVDGATGARVLVGWSAANPGERFAIGFEQGTSAQKAVWDVLQLFLGGELGAEPTFKGVMFNTALATFAAAFAVYLKGIQTIADPAPPGVGTFTPPMLTALTAFVTAVSGAQTTNVKVK